MIEGDDDSRSSDGDEGRWKQKGYNYVDVNRRGNWVLNKMICPN